MALTAGFRARQIAALTITAATVAIATGAINALLLVRMRAVEAESRTELLARTFYHLVRQTIRQHPSGDLEREIATDPALRAYAEGVVGYSPIVLYVAIRDQGGVAIFHSDPNQEGRHLAIAETLSHFSNRSVISQILALTGGNRVLIADIPFSTERGNPLGGVVVAISSILLTSQILGAVATSAFVAGGVVLVALLASFLVASRLLAPLDRLRTELARIDTGEGKPRLDLRTEADVGRLIEFFATLSERVAAGSEGRERSWVRTMLDGLADAVVVLDLDRRVLTVNDDACRLLRKSREELEGRPLDDLVAKDHPVRSLVEEALARGESVGSRTVSVSVKGREVPYLLAAHVLREGGARIRGVMVTARNVERLSRLGSQLTYSQRLAALGRLTSNVAHEIRNPLNALVIQASLLRSKLAHSGGDAGHHLDVLEEEVKRLNRVIDGFLKFVRPEEIELEWVGLAQVVRDALDLMTARAEQNGIRVESDLPESLPAVHGSADLLRQVLFNLIANACDAMPRGGTLRIRAEAPGEGSVLLIVEDTGEGILPENLPKVFDLFHTTKSKGSGIGLSLVYRIVQLHGGEVRVESERGAGTRVTIALPEGSV